MNAPSNHADDVRDLFDAKAACWSSKYRGAAVLGWRVPAFVDALAARVPPPATVLDFGCGTGEIAAALAARGYRVTGCDVANAMVEEARGSVGEAVRWVVTAGRTLPFHDAEFGAVLASSVLEYLADVDATFEEWNRVLRPGGAVIVTVPDVRHPIRRVEGAVGLLARGMAGRWMARAPGRIGSYVRYLRLSKNRWTPDEWCRIAERRGFVESGSCASYGTLLMLAFERC